MLENDPHASQEAVDFINSMRTIPFHVAIQRLVDLMMNDHRFVTVMAVVTGCVVLTKEELDSLVQSEDPALIKILTMMVSSEGGVITHVDGSKTFILHELCKNLTAGNWRARQFFSFLEMILTKYDDDNRQLRLEMASLKDEHGSIPLDYLGPEVELRYRQLLNPGTITYNRQILSPMWG